MEVERRRAARRAGVSRAALRAADAGDEDAPPRRRTGLVLVAVVVVALVVLGVYSYTVPATPQAGPTTASTQPSAPAPVVPPTGALPPLSVDPLPPVAGAAAGTPVRFPVTVLNATDLSGLAGDAARAFGAQGWEAGGVGQYEGPGVAVTTVFVTAGDEQQRQSALQLMEAFPGVVGGPADRFFDVPGVLEPGLVVVLTGEWRP
jgi:hypothetical protein